MRLTPKTEKEIAEAGLLPPGEYDFEVIGAEEQVSKAGNDMVKLSLHVFDANGAPCWVPDYLLDAMPGKLRHAAQAFGLMPDYEQGQMQASDMIGKTGRVKITIQKDKTGQFPDRNSVADYIVPKDGAATSVRNPAPAGNIDDEIPF